MKLSALLIGLFWLFALPAAGSRPISVGETEVTNSYPDSIVFTVDAASATEAIITSVEFNLTMRGASSTLVQPAEFTPGPEVEARYVWETLREGIPPGTSVQYMWVVRDDAGNQFTTQPADYVVTDSRFEWQTLENDDMALWWYEGAAEFGQSVFDSASRALAAMKDQTGLSLPFRIHVVLYGNESDFDTWHSYVREWVGGEAFPAMGLTVQIVPSGNSRSNTRWIEAVIPHEIAHLFFYQVTDTPFAMGPPTWLTEGFAQYYEFPSHEEDLDWVRRVAKRGDLIPLRLLSGSFYGDDQQIGLMYAESLSAVTFLYEQWGESGMAQLLSAHKAGRNMDEALLQATGLDSEGFQRAWWEWLGGEPGLYPTPAARAMPTVPPPPTPRPLASPVATRVPTMSPNPREPLVTPPAATTAPTMAPSPTDPPPTPTAATKAPADSTCCPSPCAGALGLLFLLAAWGQQRQAHSG